MTDRVVLKQHPRWQEPLDRFSDHGRSGGSQTLWGLHVGKKNVQQPWQIRRFSNALDKELVTISGSVTMADWAVLKLPYCEGQPVAGSVTMTDRTVLKLTSWAPTCRWSSATMADYLVLKHLPQIPSQCYCSATMADYLVLKLIHPKTAHELGRCISKYRKICLVFLFQRAVSAIFSWKVRSPQAYSRPDGGMGAL